MLYQITKISLHKNLNLKDLFIETKRLELLHYNFEKFQTRFSPIPNMYIRISTFQFFSIQYSGLSKLAQEEQLFLLNQSIFLPN